MVWLMGADMVVTVRMRLVKQEEEVELTLASRRKAA